MMEPEKVHQRGALTVGKWEILMEQSWELSKVSETVLQMVVVKATDCPRILRLRLVLQGLHFLLLEDFADVRTIPHHTS